MTGEWGAGREFRDAARAVRPDRPRDDHLHLGHDRRAQGRDAHAREPRREPARRAPTVLDVSQDDVALSFLPLSHAFERMVSYIYLLHRRDDRLRRIVRHHRRATSRRVRPTVLTGVPRVYEKLHARILEKGQAGSAAQGGGVPLGGRAPALRAGARDAARQAGRRR